MKIAFDACTLLGGASGGSGDATYLRSLLRALAHVAPENEFHLYYREFDTEREALAAQFSNVATHGRHFPVALLWSQCALAPRLARDGMDVLHAQYFLPRFCARPMVVTIHDITFHLFPQWFPPGVGRMMNRLVPRAARAARKIITGSQCTKDDIVDCLDVPPQKIVVTPYAAAPHFAPRDPHEAHRRVREMHPELQGPFIAGVGVRGPRKNIGVVLGAMAQLQARGAWPRGVKLALAGTREQFPDPEIAMLGDSVVFLGYVAESDLPDIFASAVASVYPSFYEGFGLPVLEAMSCGCPVLVSDASSLPEVAGDAGVMLAPDDVTGWAGALQQLLEDENHRATLRCRGLERAAQFSWEKCARQTLEIYREVAGQG